MSSVNFELWPLRSKTQGKEFLEINLSEGFSGLCDSVGELLANGWMDGWTDERMDGWTDGCNDGMHAWLLIDVDFFSAQLKWQIFITTHRGPVQDGDDDNDDYNDDDNDDVNGGHDNNDEDDLVANRQ